VLTTTSSRLYIPVSYPILQPPPTLFLLSLEHPLAMSTLAFITNVIDFLFALRTVLFRSQHHSHNYMYTPPTPGITTSQRPLSYVQDCEPPKPIPPPCFLGRLISHPSFKTPTIDPLVSFESSPAISTTPSASRTPRTTNSQDNFDQGQRVDARGCDRERTSAKSTWTSPLPRSTSSSSVTPPLPVYTIPIILR
jgi:hypothetical protein